MCFWTEVMVPKTTRLVSGERERNVLFEVTFYTLIPNVWRKWTEFKEEVSTGEMKIPRQSKEDFVSDTSHTPLQILMVSHLAYPIPHCGDQLCIGSDQFQAGTSQQGSRKSCPASLTPAQWVELGWLNTRLICFFQVQLMTLNFALIKS